jgi:hypothetical protein
MENSGACSPVPCFIPGFKDIAGRRLFCQDQASKTDGLARASFPESWAKPISAGQQQAKQDAAEDDVEEA